MTRNYDIRGSREFLYWAIGLALLFLWAFRDGWFPAPSKIAIHGPPHDPQDTFYIFNRTLAVASFLGALVCAVIHRIKR